MKTNGVRTTSELAGVLSEVKKQGKKIVHCHGVFDLLHVGHIRHLQAAKGYGDVLVVTVTPDRFVNKGPHRPAFPERLRADALAALSCVDYVGINEWPTAVETIRLLRPDFYVKGVVRGEGQRDHSDAINREEEAIRAVGGQLVLTDEETYSASALINRYMNLFPPGTEQFLDDFRRRYDGEEICRHLQEASTIKVLTVGEAIIDEYQFCEVMGKANKDPILAARHLRTERYAGGILAIANHVSNFCNPVGVLSILGAQSTEEDFIRPNLNTNIVPHFVFNAYAPTIVKTRFLVEYLPAKLFEVYTMRNECLETEDEETLCRKIDDVIDDFDVVIVADYGHGMLTHRAISLLCDRAKFLAVNAQTNAGNRGYNLISKYPRADFVAIDSPEAHLEVRDRNAELRDIVATLSKKIDCKAMLVTKGSLGSLCYDGSQFFDVPAFAIKTVDRIGAGDAVLALTSLCVCKKLPMDVVGFIGNVVGAEACAFMGNSRSIEPSSLYRHITSLLK